MKKTLLLSATAAILAGAFSPAVFADTTSGSTAAASSTPAPSATTAGGSMSAVVATDNVMPIVSGTTNYNFGNINYAWNNGTASLTQGTAAALVHFQYKTWRHNLIGHFQLLIQIATLLMLTVTKRLWSLTLLWKQLISTTMPQQLLPHQAQLWTWQMVHHHLLEQWPTQLPLQTFSKPLSLQIDTNHKT